MSEADDNLKTELARADAPERLAKLLESGQAPAPATLFAADRALALEVLSNVARSRLARAREALVTYLTGVPDSEIHELFLLMLRRENNYGLTEQLVTALSAHGDVAVAAKAGRIAQTQSGTAAEFAYRRVARAVAERLALSDAAIRDAVADAEHEVLARKLAQIAAERPFTGAISIPVIAAPAPTPRARMPGGVAAALIVLLALAGVGVAVWPAMNDAIDQTSVKTSSITPTAFSESKTPNAYLLARVSWDGQVERVQADAHALYIKSGGSEIIATYDGELPDVRVGDRVKFTGKITGRSRFGPILMRGLTVERARS